MIDVKEYLAQREHLDRYDLVKELLDKQENLEKEVNNLIERLSIESALLKAAGREIGLLGDALASRGELF